MAHKLELTDIKDSINLTYCCQQATVITDFSDLEAVGRVVAYGAPLPDLPEFDIPYATNIIEGLNRRLRHMFADRTVA